MRAASAAIAALLCASGCAAQASHPVPSARPPAAVHVAVLGDSLALGTGASSPSGGFAFDVYETVLRERPGSTIRNFAMGGARVDDVRRLELPRLRGAAYDLVLVVVGGNDVLAATPARRFAERYASLVDGVRRLQPRAALVVCGVPDVAVSPLFTGAERAALGARSKRDDAAVRSIAARRAVAVIDLYALSRHAAGESALFFSADRFHPSDAGYRRIADAAYPVVARALRARAASATSWRTRRTSRSG